MVVKTKHIRASQVKQEQARSMLNNHLKYLQYQKYSSEREGKQDRHFFNRQFDSIDRSWIRHNLMREHGGYLYYSCLLLTPASDELVYNWKQWTRAVMQDLENRFRYTLNWYAIACQRENTQQVSVVMGGTAQDRETGRTVSVRLYARDVQYLCERGRAQSEYGYYSFLAEKLRELDACDTISNDMSLSGLFRGQYDTRTDTYGSNKTPTDDKNMLTLE